MKNKYIKILDEAESDSAIKNQKIVGLSVLAKYGEVSMYAEHDEITVGLDGDNYDDITEEDIIMLGRCGFFWDGENECLSFFT